MADAKTTLEIIIAAQDATAGAFTSVGGKISELSGAAKDVTQPFADLAKGVLAVDAALVALTAGGLALAVQASGAFSGQFAEITTLFEASTEQIGTFRGDILAYAQDSTKSIGEINSATYTAISAGSSYADSLSLVKTAEQLAVGGKADLNASTLLLASSMNAYGASVDQAGNYSDALFVTVKDGLTTIPELAASLARVTSDAVAAGVSFDTLLAAVATLTSKGIPTSEAVTYIGAALKGIIKPTSEAEEEAQRLGLQFNLTALQSKGLAGFMAELQTKTGGNVESMNKLFGSAEAVKAVLILAGSGAEKFNATLGDMENKAGATAAAYAKMVKEFDQINQKLANNIDTVLISVGDKIKDDYAGLVGSLTTIVQSLGSAVAAGSFDELFAVIEDAMNAAKESLEGIAKALPEALAGVDFSGLASALGDVGDSINDIFGGLDLSKPEDLRQAIQTVIDTIESLTRFSGSMAEGFKPLISAVIAIIDAFNSMDNEGKAAVGSLTGLAAAISLVAVPVATVGLAIQGIGSILSISSAAVGGLSLALAGPTGLTAAFAAALASPAGLAVALTALAAAAYKVGEALYNLTPEGKEYQANLKAIAEGQKENATLAEKMAGKLAEVSAATGLTITSMDQLNKLEKDGVIVYDEATGAWKKQGEVAKLTAAELETLTKEALATGPPMKAMTAAAEVNIESFRDLKTGVIDLTAYYNALGRGDSGPIATTTKALDAAGKKSKEAEDKMLALASNEKIKAMEFSVELQTAALDAEVKKVQAAFSSIDAGIKSTGETMSSLWGTLASGGLDFTSKWALKDTLAAEEKRRDGLFKQQEKLLAAEAKLAESRADFIRKGGKVSFEITGGSPTAQYLFTELFKEAQVYAAGEGGALLLGITP